MTFNPRWIEGKTVERVEMRKFESDDGRKAHDPRITFTDGSYIRFVTEETAGEYGTSIVYRKAPPKRVSRKAWLG